MDEARKQAIRNEIDRLFIPKEDKDLFESFERIIGICLDTLVKLSNERFQETRLLDADTLFQLAILKGVTIRNCSFGSSFKSDYHRTAIPEVYDPFSVSTLVRAQFEAFCAYNHLFLQPATAEISSINYDLWVMSGLANRQKYLTTLEENMKKQKEEKAIIEKSEEKIRTSDYFKSLDTVNQAKLKDAIKKSSWQLTLLQDKVVFASWHQMALNSGIKEEMYKSIYRYLSVSTHPTYVSLFQYRDICRDGLEKDQTMFGLSLSRHILCFLLRDMCIVRLGGKTAFSAAPSNDQTIINMINVMLRGKEYSINNIDPFNP